MVQQFLSNIQNCGLFSKGDRLLLGFSGGVDSVVLAHLLHSQGYHFAIAHCNFMLRGAEADADEAFCRHMAESLGVVFYHIRFDTMHYAEENGLSIQMAARELRYNWFSELQQHYGYRYVATAHHADDSIETFFVNLIRGSGINGLQGIKALQGFVVRPLLFAFKADVMAYARLHNLPYREDSSNIEVKYKRNFIRRHIVPEFKKLNPAFGRTMMQNMEYLSESEKIVSEFCASKFQQLCEKSDGLLWIQMERLKAEPHRKTLIYHWLHPYGFNSSQLDTLLKMLEAGTLPGKMIHGNGHTLTLDRGYIVVKKQNPQDDDISYIIQTPEDIHHLPIELTIELIAEADLIHAPHVALLDAEVVSFPLILRHWQKGDKFKPLGMNGFKKLSDFFTQEKMNRFEKEQAWLLASENDIIWIIGHRIDDRFKLTQNTKSILKITYI
ncbi:MAG: tRNA lysidine(34) synthetase TilS [Bacteroidetes bacterium]|nr:tRNA lysidine(34) synthetase TilS [Bacteroidota bacterium]